MYKVVFSKDALKQLKKLDKSVAALIVGWIRKNLENCSDPRAHGKGLTANRSGQWRYHVGAYRILANINDAEITILVISVGHRRDVFE